MSASESAPSNASPSDPPGSPRPPQRHIVIVGGGLAGIAAAVRLSEAGERVTLLETRPRLGGRATSFIDPRSGLILDNCQHVLLGCCTNLIDLYDRLGVASEIAWHRTLHWTRGKGEFHSLKSSRLPAPLHMAPAFLRFGLLPKDDRTAVQRGMRAILKLGYRGRPAWRAKTFAEYLEHIGQPASAVRDFWNTVIVSACNLPVDQVGAVYALQVFQEGFLAHPFGYVMGLSNVPLLDLYEPARRAIESAGGTVRTGVSVRAINYNGSRATGVTTGDERIDASIVIAAVPPDRLHKLASETLRRADRRLQHLLELETSPILGVHLFFDEPVMDLPHLALVDRPVHWFFNKGLDERDRQMIHAVISAADDWMGLDESAIVERVMADLHHVLPGSRGIEPAEARAVKEKRATFAATPSSLDVRPSTTASTVSGAGMGGGGVENLLLAGDWTDTGWPATMEGAVRSGYAAAEAVTKQPILQPDLPTGWLARVLGLR